jgi:nucleoside-diphosphate-sugar epimerase
MNKRSLVTGGAGFLGSHLCERLLAFGWKPETLLDDGLIKTIAYFKESGAFV